MGRRTLAVILVVLFGLSAAGAASASPPDPGLASLAAHCLPKDAGSGIMTPESKIRTGSLLVSS